MSQALATASSAHQSNGLSDHASYPSPARSNTLLQTFPADADASRSRMSAMAWVRALALTPSSAARACKRAKNLRRSLSEGARGTEPSTATPLKSTAGDFRPRLRLSHPHVASKLEDDYVERLFRLLLGFHSSNASSAISFNSSR